jgi:hypothetical protein
MMERTQHKETTPEFSEGSTSIRRPKAMLVSFQYRWVDLDQPRSLWVQTLGLRSANGYRQASSVTSIVSRRNPSTQQVEHTTIKNSFDLSELEESMSLGECRITEQSTSGQLQLKGKQLRWQFRLLPNEPTKQHRFKNHFFSPWLVKAGLLKSSIVSEEVYRVGSGFIESDRGKETWKNAHFYSLRTQGRRGPSQRFFTQCNSLYNEEGKLTPYWIEGVSVQDHLPLQLGSPWFNSFRLFYAGEIFYFDKLWNSIRIRTDRNLNEWSFQLDRGPLSFRGVVKSQNKDFIGLTFEDTDEKIHHISFSQLSDLKIWIYRNGKLETVLDSQGRALFEILSADRNPYLTAAV